MSPIWTAISQARAIIGHHENSKREATLLGLASIFIFLNAVALSLAVDGNLKWSHLYAPIVWFVLIVALFLTLQRYHPGHDPFLLPVVGLMTGWGLLLMDRLAPGFLSRQLTWLVLGFIVFIFVVFLPGNLVFLRRYRYTWLTLGILLLVATFLFGVNPSGQGAKLWLKIPLTGSIYFQPSELLKLLLVVFLASYLDERGRLIRLLPSTRWQRLLAYLGPLAIMLGLCILLLIWQRDLGAAFLFLGFIVTMLYLATGDLVYVVGGILLLAVAALTGYFLFDEIATALVNGSAQGVGDTGALSRLANLLESVNRIISLRIDTWLNPWPEASARGYQIVQSLYAVASGGLFGQGIALGSPDFIPVVHSDFVFAAVAEEWGLVGGIVLIGCFVVIAYRGLHIAAKSTRPFALYLASGITLIFTFQALLILAGVTKLMPLTGITLPFISYGGSSMLASCVMIALLMHLSMPSSRQRHSKSEPVSVRSDI